MLMKFRLSNKPINAITIGIHSLLLLKFVQYSEKKPRIVFINSHYLGYFHLYNKIVLTEKFR